MKIRVTRDAAPSYCHSEATPDVELRFGEDFNEHWLCTGNDEFEALFGINAPEVGGELKMDVTAEVLED